MKRTTKKLISFLLTILIVMSLSATVFAADEDYQIFQIFTGDYSNGILSNVKWGENGSGTKGNAVDDSILTELENVKDSTSDTEKLAVITKYANLESTPFKTGSTTSYDNLPNGYYLVRNTPNTQNGTNEFYTLYVVQVVDGTLSFNPKGDVPESTKKIIEGENKVDVNEASIGDKIDYEITGTLPTNFADYNTYYYEFTDTLSKGLTFNNDLKVTIGENDVTKYFYVNATTYSAATGTTITIAIKDIKTLNNVADITIDKDTTIIVTYSATLNENAVIAGEGNPNDVVLKYSNDPNNSGVGTTDAPDENPEAPTPEYPTGETPRDEVKTYTTELTILKHDEKNDILVGAEFTLTGSGVNVVLVSTEKFTEAVDGEYWLLVDGTYTKTAPTITGGDDDNSDKYSSTTTKYNKSIELVAKGSGKNETNVVGMVDSETGTITFTGLGAGTYTITETKTPAGYNTIAPIEFTLTFNAQTNTFESNNSSIVVGEDNKLDITIVNKSGMQLPSTGGIGTILFYAIGSVLVLVAVVLLITKKRMNARD